MHSASLLQALPAPPLSSSAQGSFEAARLKPASQMQPFAELTSCSPQGAQASAALARAKPTAQPQPVGVTTSFSPQGTQPVAV
jgi:hypothetical protein